MEAFSSMRTTDNIKLEDIGCLESGHKSVWDKIIPTNGRHE